MNTSDSKTILVSLLSQLTKTELDPQSLFLSAPVAQTGPYNTRVKISPGLDSPDYFGGWFNYNRVDFTNHTELLVNLNGEAKLSDLLPKIVLVGEFSIIVGTPFSSVNATITIDDIVEADVPPVPAGQKSTIYLQANPNSYLYTGRTYVTLQG